MARRMTFARGKPPPTPQSTRATDPGPGRAGAELATPAATTSAADVTKCGDAVVAAIHGCVRQMLKGTRHDDTVRKAVKFLEAREHYADQSDVLIGSMEGSLTPPDMSALAEGSPLAAGTVIGDHTGTVPQNLRCIRKGVERVAEQHQRLEDARRDLTAVLRELRTMSSRPASSACTPTVAAASHAGAPPVSPLRCDDAGAAPCIPAAVPVAAAAAAAAVGGAAEAPSPAAAAAAAAPPSPPPPTIRPGDDVELHGLVGMPQLNGLRGTVSDHPSPRSADGTRQVVVRLPPPHDIVAIRPANLRRLSVSSFGAGMDVEVLGLVGMPHLNGLRGTITDRASPRAADGARQVVVELPPPTGCIAIRPANLRIIAGGDADGGDDAAGDAVAPAAAAPPPAAFHFAAGDEVELHGLVGMPHLNGLRGTVSASHGVPPKAPASFKRTDWGKKGDSPSGSPKQGDEARCKSMTEVIVNLPAPHGAVSLRPTNISKVPPQVETV